MKVLILSNVRWSSWNTKIQSLKDWFKGTVDLDVTVKDISLNPIFTGFKGNDGITRYYSMNKAWITQNIIPLAKGYDVVIFTMSNSDNKMFPIQASSIGSINGIQVIHGGCNEFDNYNFNGVRYDGDIWFNIMRHELCHALYDIHGKKDNTHKYWEAGTIDKCLIELRQIKEKPLNLSNTMKTVIVKRETYESKQATGTLTVEGFTCKTLERPDLNNQRNISCIPKGEYICKYTFSPKFMKYTYEVQNVPNRSSIRIHSGNYFFDIQGCILLGSALSDINKDGSKDVINSRITVNKLEQLLGKKDFKLIIK